MQTATCVGRVYVEFHEQEGKGFSGTMSEFLENRGRTKENNRFVEETQISCFFRSISMTLKSVAQSAHSILVQFSFSFASCFFCPFTHDHSEVCEKVTKRRKERMQNTMKLQRGAQDKYTRRWHR